MPRVIFTLGLLLAGAVACTARGQSYAPAGRSESQPWPAVVSGVQSRPAPGAFAAEVTGAQALSAAKSAVQPASYTAPAAESQALPLPPPSRRADAPTRTSPGKTGQGGSSSSLFTLGTSLALVLGLFLAAAWLLRKTGAVSAATLPKEVLEVLGRAPLAARQQVHLVRCGRKLLLVCVSPAGVETLTEITDPPEVDRLAGLCQQARADSASTVFRQVFQQFAQPAGFRGKSKAVLEDELHLANAGIADVGGELAERRHV